MDEPSNFGNGTRHLKTLPFNPQVVGSIPTGPTKLEFYLSCNHLGLGRKRRFDANTIFAADLIFRVWQLSLQISSRSTVLGNGLYAPNTW